MYRLFVLGAGFSRFAGLPLGNELLNPILDEAKKSGVFHFLEEDLTKFANYQKWSAKRSAEVNIEEFISYLDVVHFLKLDGKDRWSSRGSKTQVIIHNLIARILYQKQLDMSLEAKKLYDDFVMRLDPTDWIITFNYDTILEEAMKRKEVKYRLFPQKLKRVSKYGGIGDIDSKEVVLLKMHGSINWFDSTEHEEMVAERRKVSKNISKGPHWSIFSDPNSWSFSPLLTGAHLQSDPLAKIKILENMADYIYRNDYLLNSPFIISPSYSKIVYLNPLTEFWRSFKHAGTLNSEVTFIGFSFPEHDEYLRVPLLQLITNFQEHNYIHELESLKLKAKELKIVDFKITEQEISDFKNKLSGVDWAKTLAIWNGFCPKTISDVFNI